MASCVLGADPPCTFLAWHCFFNHFQNQPILPWFLGGRASSIGKNNITYFYQSYINMIYVYVYVNMYICIVYIRVIQEQYSKQTAKYMKHLLQTPWSSTSTTPANQLRLTLPHSRGFNGFPWPYQEQKELVGSIIICLKKKVHTLSLPKSKLNTVKS